MKNTIKEAKDSSYKKWTFLRNMSYSTNNYSTAKKIQEVETKEYYKFQFLKKLSEAVDKVKGDSDE